MKIFFVSSKNLKDLWHFLPIRRKKGYTHKGDYIKAVKALPGYKLFFEQAEFKPSLKK
ncbi:hypothetical protein AGMMS49579_25170 [Spirochaetia bacterium]|nr:hypothetical protein AGMMS49579_25170 [Spirochaetia bacterium]